MRVYICGSHSGGKSTLARYISRVQDLPLIPEVARQVLIEMQLSLAELRTDPDKIADFQRTLFFRQIEIERATGHSFVSDRAFDNIAYAAQHTTICAALTRTDEFAQYMRWVARGRVFFIRPHKSLVQEDGVRETPTWEGILQIDGMIKLLLEMHEVPYLSIATPSMQERIRTVEFVIPKPETKSCLPLIQDIQLQHGRPTIELNVPIPGGIK